MKSPYRPVDSSGGLGGDCDLESLGDDKEGLCGRSLLVGVRGSITTCLENLVSFNENVSQSI